MVIAFILYISNYLYSFDVFVIALVVYHYNIVMVLLLCCSVSVHL